MSNLNSVKRDTRTSKTAGKALPVGGATGTTAGVAADLILWAARRALR